MNCGIVLIRNKNVYFEEQRIRILSVLDKTETEA